MIISKPLKFWFIHVPKVAGSSVRERLLPYNTSDLELWHQRFIPSLDRIIDMSHIAALDVPHVVQVPDDYFRFGFVRNPYQRFFSAIREHARQNKLSLTTPEEISEFVLSRLTHTSVRFDWNLSHFCPQHYYFYAGFRQVADFIGRHHAIEEDWRKILTFLNLPFEGHELGRARDSKIEYVDPTTLSEAALSRINSLYAKDWMLFSPLFTEAMIGTMEHGTHQSNVHNTRTLEGRVTFYGEPPGLSIHEKAGFLTTEVERLQRSLTSIASNQGHSK